MTVKPPYLALVEATDRPEEAERLLEVMRQAPPAHSVRAAFGYLMRDYALSRDEAFVASIAPLLDLVLLGLFRRAPVREGAALAALLGSHLFPSLGLVEAANRTLQETIEHHRDQPYIQTLLVTAEGSWTRFVDDMDNWQSLVWNVDANIEWKTEQCVWCHYDNPLAAYVGPGFWQGMMTVFGVDGEAKMVEAGHSYASAEIRW